MIAVALGWNQLFLVYDFLPATIPPAVVLIGTEAWRRLANRASLSAALAPPRRPAPRAGQGRVS